MTRYKVSKLTHNIAQIGNALMSMGPSVAQCPASANPAARTSEQHVTEAAVLPSEIEQLPDLHGFLKVASQAEWRRVTLRPEK